MTNALSVFSPADTQISITVRIVASVAKIFFYVDVTGKKISTFLSKVRPVQLSLST